MKKGKNIKQALHWFLSLTAVFGAIAHAQTICPVPPVQGLPWSAPSTWGGAVPGAGATVVIPAGQSVVLDVSPPPLKSITIEGQLRFDPTKDIDLAAESIIAVGQNALFEIGSASAPYIRRASITLTGSASDQNIMGVGTKVLGATEGGKIRIFGEPRAGWTQLSANALPGATSLFTKDAMLWRAGDRIVIAPSGFEAEEYEEVTVTAVSSNQITFTPALKFQHWGGLQTFEGKTLDQRAAVGLVSRNIVIRGDAQSDANAFGGHIMSMPASSLQISGVELTKMGQRGRKGRYPVHWHLANDRSGDFIRDSSIHRSFQRAVVIHGTNKILVQGNVAFDITNHAYVWAEDGNEKDNRFLNNLAVFNKSPEQKDFAFPTVSDILGNSLQSEFRSASFWGRNFSNTISGNIAAGSVDGFGFFLDRFSGDIVGNSEGLGLVFEDNIAHSNYRPEARGVAGEIYPEATFGHGLMVSSGLQEIGPHVLKRFTSYKNYGGAWLEDRVTELQDSMLADNGTGAYMLRGVVDGVTIVMKTANTLGNAEIPPKGGFATENRGAVVVPSSHGGARAPILKNLTVVNHDDAAYVIDVGDLGYSARVDNMKLVNVRSRLAMYETRRSEYDYTEHGIDDSKGLLSGDGQPTVWVKRRSPLVTANCRTDTVANGYACPMNEGILLRYENAPSRWTWLVQPHGSVLGLGQPWYFDRQLAQPNSGWIANGAQYEVLSEVADIRDIVLQLEQSGGKSFEMSWAANAAPTAFTQNGANVSRATSLASMRAQPATSYFYDVGVGKLYAKIVGGSGVQTLAIGAAFAPTRTFAGRAALTDISQAVPGFRATTYAGAASNFLRQAIPTTTPVLSANASAATMESAAVAPYLSNNINVTTVFSGYIYASVDGIYNMSVPAIGGHVDLFVGERWVTGSSDNTWTVRYAPEPLEAGESGLVALKQGWHPVSVVFGRNQVQQGYNDPVFWLRWALPGSNMHSVAPVYRLP